MKEVSEVEKEIAGIILEQIRDLNNKKDKAITVEETVAIANAINETVDCFLKFTK